MMPNQYHRTDQSLDLVAIWPDGTECELDEVQDMLKFCSDDFDIAERHTEEK